MTDEIPATMTIELSRPVHIDGREYTQLVLREPSTKEVLNALKQLVTGHNAYNMRNMEIHLVASAANVPLPVIENAPISALFRAMGYIQHFLAESPTL